MPMGSFPVINLALETVPSLYNYTLVVYPRHGNVKNSSVEGKGSTSGQWVELFMPFPPLPLYGLTSVLRNNV